MQFFLPWDVVGISQWEVSKDDQRCCWFSCGGGKENISWILRRSEDQVMYTVELLVTVSHAMQSNIPTSQKTLDFP
jgi:hypothetical protein